MWLCPHIHFMHQLIGALFLQSLLLPLSGELPHQNFGKLKPHIWTRTTLEMEARQLCQTTMVFENSGICPAIIFAPTLHPLTHSCTHAYILCMVLCWYSDGVVTLTSSPQGGICPGEEVILTCTVTGGVSLEWSSTAFSPVVRFVGNDVGQTIVRGIFTVTLISPLTSTLRVTTTLEAMLNGTIVTCSDQLNPRSVTLTLAGGFIVYCSCEKCMIVRVNCEGGVLCAASFPLHLFLAIHKA